MTIETLGVDIAKTVFQLHGVNRNGRVVFKRRVMRDQLLAVIAQIEPCTIAIEACTGAFYWQRKFETLNIINQEPGPPLQNQLSRPSYPDDGQSGRAKCICRSWNRAGSPRRHGRSRPLYLNLSLHNIPSLMP